MRVRKSDLSNLVPRCHDSDAGPGQNHAYNNVGGWLPAANVRKAVALLLHALRFSGLCIPLSGFAILSAAAATELR